MEIPYTAPALNAQQFNCPACRAFAQQIWFKVTAYTTNFSPINCEDIGVALCAHCRTTSKWLDGKLIKPRSINAPPVNRDLAEEIQRNYEEAAMIEQDSPKGAAALLRLCVQQLCKQLGEAGNNINNDIASLVKKGLPREIQQALDVVRVVGNNAVHPGEIMLDDQPDTVAALFTLVNAIADRMITQPKKIAALYSALPESIVASIERRDKPRS